VVAVVNAGCKHAYFASRDPTKSGYFPEAGQGVFTDARDSSRETTPSLFHQEA